MNHISPVVALSLSLSLLACAADVAAESAGTAAVAPFDEGRSFPDIGFGDIATPQGDVDFEDGPLPQPGLTPQDAVFPQEILKDVPDYLVPASVGAKKHLALSLTTAAWVSVGPRGRRLVTWDLFSQSAPKTWEIPSVVNPRQLAVSDPWLVWVDVTFDPNGDIFALNLDTGVSLLVVGAPGAQQRPAVEGSVLVWEDCRACLASDQRPTPSIYRRVLGEPTAEEVLSTSDLSNTLPVHGTLASGNPAVAWLVGTRNIRVLGDGVDLSFEAPGRGIEGLSLQSGHLAFRTQPAIINPDSMIPTDPWVIDVASASQTLLASNQTLLPGLPTHIVPAGDGFAWLSQSSPDLGDVRVAVVSAQGVPITAFEAPAATEIVGANGWIGLVAALDANGNQSDIFLTPSP